MGNIKKNHSSAFKSKIALEVIKGQSPMSLICSRYNIHHTQANRWKDKALESIADGFNNRSANKEKEKDELIEELYKQVGQLKVELDWLKKIWVLNKKEKVNFINPNSDLSIIKQCEILGLNRSSYYYQPKPESELNLYPMSQIDKIYTDKPYLGGVKITDKLNRTLKEKINHKRVERLMKLMGIQAVRPKVNLSKSNKNHVKYPYLLKNLIIKYPNHVWGVDITYIRANGQWFYLVAIIDWYSRYVISWELSLSLKSQFCVDCLKRALSIAIPEIHNSDQGVQFTSEEYIALLKEHEQIKISMDGKGRCFDNIFTERLWRSLKYEEVYLKEYNSFDEAKKSIAKYFYDYNFERPHQALKYQMPAEVYFPKNIVEKKRIEALKLALNENNKNDTIKASENIKSVISNISKVEIHT